MRRTRNSRGRQQDNAEELDGEWARAELGCEGGAPAIGHPGPREWDGRVPRRAEAGARSRLDETPAAAESVGATLDRVARAMDWASAELRQLIVSAPRDGERTESREGEGRSQTLYERAGLTRCEQEVLELAEEGNKTVKIAERRGVSRHTVRTQLTKARQKVRASQVGMSMRGKGAGRGP